MARPSRIRDLPLSTRPREKLLARGRENLSDGEILALLLGSGSSKQNAITLAKKILKRFNWDKLREVSIENLQEIDGIGKAKATRIKAAIEVGERVFRPAPLNRVVINSRDKALAELKEIAAKKQEYVVVLYLNARSEMIQKETVGLGNLNTNLIEPKEVFAPALATPCSGIILAHNHPSGDPSPSQEDLAFTKRIWEGGRIMGVDLLDHIIVAEERYFSFKAHDFFK